MLLTPNLLNFNNKFSFIQANRQSVEWKSNALVNSPAIDSFSYSKGMTNNLTFKGLNKTSRIQQEEHENNKFDLNLSTKELDLRTADKSVFTINLLTPKSPEYTNLAKGDKKALAHLTKAAYILEDVFLKQDHPDNIAFRNYLAQEMANGNADAQKTLTLFNGQKGVIGTDFKEDDVVLMKGAKTYDGAGFFDRDISKDEFKTKVKQMLVDGEDKEVSALLNQRSVVIRQGDKLVAVDFTQAYKKEFQIAAKHIEMAAKYSTNKDFNEYLILQAKALRKNDPMLDAAADLKWASLQDTPLEFTISRDNYAESITESVNDDAELAKMLEYRGIRPITKDTIGVRVGIVNKKGTEAIVGIKKHLKKMADNMPFNSEYEQKIFSTETKGAKQAMIDADIVAVTGDLGCYRGGIVLAENLPNEDKLSLQLGGGKRNVFHRQMRFSVNPRRTPERMNKFMAPDIKQYYDEDAIHKFTNGHENLHILGPKQITSKIDKNTAGILEEEKADAGSLSNLDLLEKEGFYTEKEKKQIYTSFTMNRLTSLEAMPKETDIHKVRSVMELNQFIEDGAIRIEKKGFINSKPVVHIDFDKMGTSSRKLLENVVRIQIDDNPEAAGNFVNHLFKWSDGLELFAKQAKEDSPTLNGTLKAPLAEMFLNKVK